MASLDLGFSHGAAWGSQLWSLPTRDTKSPTVYQPGMPEDTPIVVPHVGKRSQVCARQPQSAIPSKLSAPPSPLVGKQRLRQK